MVNKGRNSSRQHQFRVINCSKQNQQPYTRIINFAENCHPEINNNLLSSSSRSKSFQVRETVTRSDTNERRGRKTRNLFAVKAYNRRTSERRRKL